MEILESMEVRWFFGFADPICESITEWFASVASEGPREDRYLGKGRADLGIKVRTEENKPAKFETKHLLGSLGSVALAPNVQGDLERWRKVSLELDPKAVQESKTWLSVGKDRKLRKFALRGGSIAEVGAKDRPAAGCNVEWTQLDVGHSIEWTLGLESFGPSGEMLGLLQDAAKLLFAERPSLAIPASSSLSYAAWVAHFTA